MPRLDKSLRSLITKFDAAWSRGIVPDIGKFVRRAIERNPALSNAELFRAFLESLIASDVEWRCSHIVRRRGSSANLRLLDWYVAAFSQLGPVEDLPTDLIVKEFLARYKATNRAPAIKNYLARFRDRDGELAGILQRTAEEAVKLELVLPAIKGVRIGERIGEGRFGNVHRGFHTRHTVPVAIKYLKIGSMSDGDALRRFENEAKALANVRHPNVILVYDVRVYDVRTKVRRPYILMEYASGGTLRSRIRQWHEAIPTDRSAWERMAAAVMRDVASGLAIAHQQGVFHRDLKPENVLFDSQGVPKIADFGQAQIGGGEHTQTGQAMGTPGYLSPELARNARKIDARSDIYSLGVILFEILTKELPFPISAVADVADARIQVDFRRASDGPIHPDLLIICQRCLYKDPSERFTTAGALADDLERFVNGHPILAQPATRWEKAKRFIRHRPWLTATAILLMSAVIVGYLFADRTQLYGSLLKERGNVTARNDVISQQNRTITEQKVRVESSERSESNAREERNAHAYAADLQAVQAAWGTGNVKLMRELLNRHDPQLNGGNSDLRGFEWHYWKHLLRAREVFQNGSRCRSMTIDQQGKRLAATDFENVTVWNLATSEQEFRWAINVQPNGNPFRFHRDLVADSSVAFSSDGKFLTATGYVKTDKGRFGTLRVWNLEAGTECLLIADDPGLSGQAVTFSPDNKEVITGHIAHGWKSWNIESGKVAHQGGPLEMFPDAVLEKAKDGFVTSLVFDRDGRTLYSGCYPTLAAARRWPDGKVDPILEERYPSRARRGGAAIRSEYGSFVSFGNDGKPTIASLDTFGHAFLHVSGRRADVAERVYDVAIPVSTRLNCLSWNDPYLLAGGEDGIVYLFECMNILGKVNVKQTTLRGHETPLACVAMGPNHLPISGDDGGTIRIWRGSADERVLLTGNKHCMTAKVDADSKGITLCGHAGEPIGQIPLEKKMGVTIWASPNERFVVIGLTDNALLWRYILWDGESRRTIVARDCKYISQMSHVAFSEDESRVAITTDGGLVTILSTHTGSVIREVPLDRTPQIALSRSGRFFAAFGPLSIYLWDLDSRKEGRSLAMEGLEPAERTCVFSSDEKRLILDSNPCLVWSVETGELLPTTTENSLAEPRADTPRVRRLYRTKRSEERLQIMCGRTLRELLTVKVRWHSPYDAPSMQPAEAWVVHPVPAANGFVAMPFMDKRLEDIVAEWDKPASAPVTATGPPK